MGTGALARPVEQSSTAMHAQFRHDGVGGAIGPAGFNLMGLEGVSANREGSLPPNSFMIGAMAILD